MTDRPLDGLDIPLDYLELQDDPILAADDISATGEIAAVRDLGSTGELLLDDETLIERVPTAIQTDDASTTVYGVGLVKPRGEDRRTRLSVPRVSPLALAGLALAALLAVVGVVFVPRIIAARQPTGTGTLVRVTPEEPEEPEVEPATNAGAIKMAIGSLTYQQTSVPVAAGDVTVEVRDGHVVVTHELKSVEGLDAAALVRASSQRAAALAAQLTGQRVTQEDDADGADFAGLTWVVREAGKGALLAIAEAPGELRTAEGAYGLLAGAKGYALAADLLAALGEDPGLMATAGEAPTDVEGNAVAVTGTLPQPEPEPEPEAEAEASEEYTEGESYYYEEPTYTEPAYEEPTYTEPVYEEPSSDEPSYEEPTYGDNGDYDYSYDAPGDGGSDEE